MLETLDWLVLCATLLLIVLYGMWKARDVSNVKSYLLGNRDLKWWTIGLSVMATQASAITFLSTPGKAFEDGLGFAQFYFGLPIAMVILCAFVLPIYYRSEVFTAYEYLEGRFDRRTRSLTAFLFLIQRGLAAGITIYAPAIILSTILGWGLYYTIIIIGVIVIFYTVIGGSNAVSQTQKQQMIVILTGMFVAFLIILWKLPEGVGLQEAISVAGKLDKLNVVSLEFDLEKRYNIWSALLGGTFLFLSYFGTDQSQVQRYLSGKSLTESRLGLLFNGLFKVPMQFGILFVGIMVFIFFLFTKPPIHFNNANLDLLQKTEAAPILSELQEKQDQLYEESKEATYDLINVLESEDQSIISASTDRIKNIRAAESQIRDSVRTLIGAYLPDAESKDSDYVFIYFVINYLPAGLVGLLLAVIFSAAMSSTSSELNALATTFVIDFYKRSIRPDESDAHYLTVSKWSTILWGLLALTFAASASLFDNLIEAVNIVGSLFYGVILGIFAVAFFFKWIGPKAVFQAALISEAVILALYFMTHTGYLKIPYLYLNMIGCMLVILISAFSQRTRLWLLDG